MTYFIGFKWSPIVIIDNIKHLELHVFKNFVANRKLSIKSLKPVSNQFIGIVTWSLYSLQDQPRTSHSDKAARTWWQKYNNSYVYYSSYKHANRKS